MLARRGADLVVVGRSTAASPNRLFPGTLEDVDRELRALGARVLPIAADLASVEDTQRVIQQTNEQFGRCDILIDNAAFMPSAPIMTTPPARWSTTIRINAVAPLQLCQGFLAGMLDRRWGRVLNVSSGASSGGPPGLLLYSTSKVCLERLTEALGAELAGQDVAITAVPLGEVATEMWQRATSSGAMDRQGTPSSDEVYHPDDVAEAFGWILDHPDDGVGRI